MNLNLDELKDLIATLEEGGVREFEYEDENSRVRLAFGAAGVAVAAAPPAAGLSAPVAASAAPAESDANLTFITSPFVGTFYRSPAPGADMFTDVGKAVKPGQILCIVEAMKLMNEIECDVAGTILEILVDNGTSVEFGQKLFKVKKA
jgi:acetyl-CoA carboxylase biotin carboxyl carrier protein